MNLKRLAERCFRSATPASPSRHPGRHPKAEAVAQGSLLSGALTANQITIDLLEWEETVETVVMGGDE